MIIGKKYSARALLAPIPIKYFKDYFLTINFDVASIPIPFTFTK
jgi:hypothetical protein